MKEIVNQLTKYIGNVSGQNGRNWYIGIASDPESRLFEDHCVNKEYDYWIYRQAISDTEARAVEEYLIKKLNTKGNPGGGDSSTKFVYAYLITSTTRE